MMIIIVAVIFNLLVIPGLLIILIIITSTAIIIISSIPTIFSIAGRGVKWLRREDFLKNLYLKLGFETTCFVHNILP